MIDPNVPPRTQSWRTRSHMYGVYCYAEDLPTALRELALQLEINDEMDKVADVSYGLADDEGYWVGALIEEAYS